MYPGLPLQCRDLVLVSRGSGSTQANLQVQPHCGVREAAHLHVGPLTCQKVFKLCHSRCADKALSQSVIGRGNIP